MCVPRPASPPPEANGPSKLPPIRSPNASPRSIDGRDINLGGDVITAIDDKTVRKIDDILVYLEREKTVDDNLKLTILREGQLQDINIALAARPNQFESP